MYNDSKMTYIVIAILVVLLAGVAYFLRSNSQMSEEILTNIPVTTTNSDGTQTIKNSIIIATTTAMTSTTTSSQKANGAILHTSMGDIEVVFDYKNAPNTVINFVTLAATNLYDGVRFHRVIKDFMIQTGDPQSKDKSKMAAWGTGGPGYTFKDELKGTEQYLQGTLAMANSGPNTNGSQFFIVTATPGVALPPSYTVFGKVVKGIEVAMKIQNVKTVSPGQVDRPVEDVILTSVELK